MGGLSSGVLCFPYFRPDQESWGFLKEQNAEADAKRQKAHS